MIIGTITEPALNQGSNFSNGATAVIFYTERDCVQWCIAMSEEMIFAGSAMRAATVMYNTETGNKRWWYNGVEYTG